jgi:predicted DNA-binding protein
VVLVIAFPQAYGYTVITTNRKENGSMAATKNLCAQISLDLHQKISEAKEAAGLTTAQYITNLLTEYFTMKENGGNVTMANNNTRTMAFQIPEELFQRIKIHLERETQRTGRKLTQREFVLGLIEEALNEAERLAAEEAGYGNAHGEDADPEEEAPEKP